MAVPLEAHYRQVAQAILEGRVVPMLGAGVNLCGRPPEASWRHGEYLPSGAELANHLADYFGYPDADRSELVRVSEYISVTQGAGPLYRRLHKLFDADYPATPLHELLASIPAMLRANGETTCPVILTTNYDDALERAFTAAGEPYDVVVYTAEGDNPGKFRHYSADAPPELILRPNKYSKLSNDRSVILKIHGAIDRGDFERDSYVITEDHYIDYLTRTDPSALVPAAIMARLQNVNFLFLGYGMRDWNLRVILRRIWVQQRLSYRSWAVQLQSGEMEREFWRERGVDIFDLPLEDYVAALRTQIEQLSTTEAVAS